MIKKKDDLIQTYTPIATYFDNDHNRIYKTIKGLELIINNINNGDKTYKFIIITRFDIYFLHNFANIDFNKLNIVSILEHQNACDDNFHLFPVNYLNKFYELLVSEANNTNFNSLLLHHLIHKFTENFNINYLYNEYKSVSELSFFKLRFFSQILLKINRYLFTNDVWYNSIEYNSKMLISNNIIYFNKIINKPRFWCWISYDLHEKGKYNLSFEILSNKDIINYNFIKLHKPETFYATQNIYANQWTQIYITLNVLEDGDDLCLIFDDFSDTINIQFKNIKIELIT